MPGANNEEGSSYVSTPRLGPAGGRATLDCGSSLRSAAHNRNHPREGARRDLRRRDPELDCEEDGPLYTITTTSNLVEHETIFDDGRVHATFTQTGTFVAVPLEDPSLPSFTGRFTQWGNFNQNGNTVNGTFTFNLRGTGSDGSTLSIHQVDHFNERPDGTVNEFFHCH